VIVTRFKEAQMYVASLNDCEFRLQGLNASPLDKSSRFLVRAPNK